MNLLVDLKHVDVENNCFTKVVPMPDWDKKRIKKLITDIVKEIKGINDARTFTKVMKKQIDDLAEAIDTMPSFSRPRVDMHIALNTTPESYQEIFDNRYHKWCERYNEIVDRTSYTTLCRKLAEAIYKDYEGE